MISRLASLSTFVLLALFSLQSFAATTQEDSAYTGTVDDWRVAPLVGGRLIPRTHPEHPYRIVSGDGVGREVYLREVVPACIRFFEGKCSLFQFVGFTDRGERVLLNDHAFVFYDRGLVKKLKRSQSFDYFYESPFQTTKDLNELCIDPGAWVAVAVVADLVLMPVAAVVWPAHWLHTVRVRSAYSNFFKDGKTRQISARYFDRFVYRIGGLR